MLALVVGFALAVGAESDAVTADEVRALVAEGQYARAADRARLLHAATADPGEPSPQRLEASDVLVRALLLEGATSRKQLREAAEANLARRRAAGQGTEAVASLRNLASLLSEEGDFAGAQPLLAEALPLCESAGRPLELAELLDDLGHALSRMGRFAEAEAHLQRAWSLKQSLLPPGAASLARTLEALAWLAQDRGDYKAERPLVEQALLIRSRQPLHPEVLRTLEIKCGLLWFEGDPAGIVETAGRAVAIGEQTLGSAHPRLVPALEMLAYASHILGDRAGAKAALERAAQILRQGPDPKDEARIEQSSGSLALAWGDYTAARGCYERALEAAMERHGRTHEDVAANSHNLAIVQARLGDFDSARRYEEVAIEIWETLRGADHPFIALGLDDLGEVLMAQGRHREAADAFERAHAIRARAFQPEHRSLAEGLTSLAKARLALGDADQALELNTRAMGIWTHNPDAERQATFAASLELQGTLEAGRGAASAAIELQRRALAVRMRVLGETHPQVADSNAAVARALLATGDLKGALRHALAAEAIGRDHLRLSAGALSERQGLTYAAVRPIGLDIAAAVVVESPSLAGASAAVLDAVVRSRALVLDETGARLRLSASNTAAELKALWEKLAAARQRLANLVVRAPLERETGYAALVAEMRQQRDRAEDELAARSASFRAERAREQIGLAEVAGALPADAALVSYFRSKARLGSQQSDYMAFVLRGRQAPSFVPLGAATPIDAAVSAWRTQASATEAGAGALAEHRYRTAGDALRRLVWDPLRGELAGARRVFVVPDGQLHLVSFASLPDGGSSYLVETGPVLHYFSAERDLASVPSPIGQGMLALGGATFDDSSATRIAGAGALRGRRLACGSFATLRFDTLPASAGEAEFVARSWSSSDAAVLTGTQANEAAFKQRAPGRRVLHLATHGFVLGEDCASSEQDEPSPGESPLLRAGLALAGANKRALAGPEEEDGILTGEEVVALDLGGVEWAVLSACDTGLGDVRAGEGVLGLRRAFQLAGARTVIMSLWPVEDEATTRWMSALYAGRFGRGLDTAQAVHEASLSNLRALRERGANTHPGFWAGFVAAGDWR